MFDMIHLQFEENLPMPLIYLASPEVLADWYVSQMEWAANQGHRELTISCFDTAPMGYDIKDAAPIVLQAVKTFLANRGDIIGLTILCGDETALRAYSQLLQEYSDF